MTMNLTVYRLLTPSSGKYPQHFKKMQSTFPWNGFFYAYASSATATPASLNNYKSQQKVVLLGEVFHKSKVL